MNPASVASDPFAFRCYIQSSGAEFSVAQGVYVDIRSGWFSDRTARSLASGKPVLVQETWLGRMYPVGLGLVPFRTLAKRSEARRLSLATTRRTLRPRATSPWTSLIRTRY